MSSSLLAPQVVATRTIYEVDDETSLEVSTRNMSLLALPTVDVSVHRLLSPSLKSWTTLHSGSLDGSDSDLSSLSIGVTSLVDPSSPDGGWTGELAVGPGDASVNVDWSKTVWAGWEVKVGGSLGFNGTKGFLSWARKVTELIKLTLSVEGACLSPSPSCARAPAACRTDPPLSPPSAELATGLTLKIRFYRLGQSVSVPVTLVRKLDYLTVAIATLLPCVAIGTLQHTYLGPRRRRIAAQCVPSTPRRQFVRRTASADLGAPPTGAGASCRRRTRRCSTSCGRRPRTRSACSSRPSTGARPRS